MSDLVNINKQSIDEYRAPDIIEEFLKDIDVSPGTRNQYRRNLRQFTAWLDSVGITDPGRRTILDFKTSLDVAGKAANTVNAYMTTVRQLYKWAETQGYYRDITRGIKGARQPKPTHISLSSEQAHHLLESIDRSTRVGKRDYALINLLLRTGLRTIEAARANIEDMQPHGGKTVLWVQGKGHRQKDDLVVLTMKTQIPIAEYIATRPNAQGDSPLFHSLSNRSKGERLSTRSISWIVSGRLQHAGLKTLMPKLSAHKLRHTAITLLVAAGVSVERVQSMARHQSIATTMIYFNNQARLTNAPEEEMDNIL